MVRLATLLGRSMLLAGYLALSAQASASAQPEQKPSKPLNLATFAKTSRVPPSRPVAKLEAPPGNPQPELPLTTATVARSAASPSAPAEPTDQRGSDATDFCKNITDAALDARVAWQQKQLEASEAKLRERIVELEAKRAEYEKWLKLREDFLKKAEDNVVEIYSGMNPDAAAQQIASMADETAAAVLAKLRVRTASAILNEMEPGRAAHLADTLAGMRRPDDGKTNK
ncbi:MotE family protein [Bradyrhizobium sp. Ai1a-2]|uniref:MotE family protein n=1 Tax=Bradyrhizobium sp. Ai1a-2 TaxID=196490 RepID=UPI0004864BF8|nr:MotE family protein [Bradyrhizobium sp. Ai1a-2]